MRTGKWTVSSRLTSRRPRRASSERPITSAAASKRRWAVWKAEARVSTAIAGPPIVLLRRWPSTARSHWPQNWPDVRRQLVSIGVVAAVALATGFLVAGQVKAQLADALQPGRPVPGAGAQRAGPRGDQRRLPPADRRAPRRRSTRWRPTPPSRSAATQALQNQVADLRAHAGLTALHGPGVEVDLANGVPGPDHRRRRPATWSTSRTSRTSSTCFSRRAPRASR